MLRVHLIDLKSYYPSPPFQLGLLAAYSLQEEEVRKNLEFIFSSHPREQPATEIAEAILASESEVIGMSNYAWNYRKICQILDLLTAADVRLPRIVLGGPNSAGEMGIEMLGRYPIISALVEGEGEPAFRDIASSLVDSPEKDPFVSARNCLYRREDGTIARPGQLERIQNLDDIPSPYLTGIIPPHPSPIFYETNRGCPYRCSFCYWGNGNSKVYRMSHDRVREEMEFFARNKVFAFWITDANFGIFPDDSKIAEIMAQTNDRHGRPFKHVGVNWAKNSHARVLELGSILKNGGMTCTTTLALQSVTPEAEKQAQRYAMQPSKFVGLISNAERMDLDTYTDIIWGLPGENIEEHLDTLNAVIATGVPAILIHQLYLLPGTEFYDEREKFGLKMVKESDVAAPDPSERSDYWDYIVVSHPKMSRADWSRGSRVQGISHVLHNHDLGRVVGFYLARYGLTHRDVYVFFDELLMGRVPDFPEAEHPILAELRRLIVTWADTVGLDEYIFYMRLSRLMWYRKNDSGLTTSVEPAVRAFMHEFFRALCRRHGICTTEDEQALLADFVDFNVTIAPRPGWTPAPRYVFRFDVAAMWKHMLEEILRPPAANAAAAGTRRLRLVQSQKASADEAQGTDDHVWGALAADVRSRVAALFTDDYIARARRQVVCTVMNPWVVAPSNSDWLLSSRSKHCVVTEVPQNVNSAAQSA